MNSTRVLATTAAVVLLVSSCVTVVPPTIESAISDVTYISPANGDGVADQFAVPFSVSTAKERTIITGYRIDVTDAAGRLVRSNEERLDRPGFWERVGIATRLRKKTPLDVPGTIEWDGRSEEGAFVPDGPYELTVQVWDDAGGTTLSPSARIVVDNTPPQVDLSIPYRIFSPNGDGNKDTLRVSHATTREDRWDATIEDASGATVARYSWPQTPPATVEWDGRDEAGRPLADGTYVYRIVATDRAGNRGGASLESVGINTRPTPVSIGVSRYSFSPNNDDVAETTEISPVFPLDGLDGWTLDIVDSADNRVRRLRGTDTVSFVWDGTDDLGTPLPDGTYHAEFDALYENGNNPSVRSATIEIDRVFPQGTATSNVGVFSPDGDGRKDSVSFAFRDASREAEWVGEVLNERRSAILRRLWEGTPTEFIWHGLLENGAPAPDGTYTYRLSATDAAGNAFTATPVTVRLDTRPVRLTVSPSLSAFSPNGDGISDSITITSAAEPRDGITDFSIAIKDGTGRTVRTFTGTGVIPYTWNGLNVGGGRSPDGVYTAVATATWEKGNVVSATSAQFTMDTIAPQVEVAADYTVFSPDGDGRRDTVVFVPRNASPESRWTGEVRSATGQTVSEATWSRVPGRHEWNGRGRDGRTVPDGVYSYHLFATDIAGNIGGAVVEAIRVDTRPRPLTLTADTAAFSPNDDGVQDVITLRPEIQEVDGLNAWEITIRDRRERTIKTFRGTTPPATVVWDGTTDAGGPAADGTYIAQLSATYTAGPRPTVTTEPFVIDTVPPVATIAVDRDLFSPDGDGRLDTVTIEHRNATEEVLWTAAVVGESGRVLRHLSWAGRPETIVWDGTDGVGNAFQDGSYRYRLSSADSAGNRFEAESSVITIDRRPTPVGIGLRSAGFSPNGDGTNDVIGLDTSVAVSDGIREWSIGVTDARGERSFIVRSGTRGPVPASFTWDGIIDGRPAPEGRYHATLTVDYAKGNRGEARTADFVLDVTAPTLTLQAGPVPFSPDGDGNNDSLRITVRATDDSGVIGWNVAINDPVGNRFISFAGSGSPPTQPIVWDGRSPNGEVVQSASDYSIVMTAQDVWGNHARAERVLPTDILVFRDGDTYKIQISSIYFAPFTAEYQPGKEADNERTLRRLAEILALPRFAGYRIAIEGHAVRIYWYDEARGRYEEEQTLQPLSMARAETVKQALVTLGIAARRMSTQGFGGTHPFVPHSDIENRWKNRRVEFVLRR